MVYKWWLRKKMQLNALELAADGLGFHVVLVLVSGNITTTNPASCWSFPLMCLVRPVLFVLWICLAFSYAASWICDGRTQCSTGNFVRTILNLVTIISCTMRAKELHIGCGAALTSGMSSFEWNQVDAAYSRSPANPMKSFYLLHLSLNLALESIQEWETAFNSFVSATRKSNHFTISSRFLLTPSLVLWNCCISGNSIVLLRTRPLIVRNRLQWRQWNW